MNRPFASPLGRYTFWLGLPLLLLAGGPLIDSPFALIDRLGHFPVQCAVAAFVLAIWAVVRRRRPGSGWILVVTFGAFLLNGAWLLPYLPVASEREHVAVTAWIRKENPDVLVVQEVDSQWREAFKGINDIFGYRIIVERKDDFGLAVFSKHRILSRTTDVLPFINVPALFVVLDFRGVTTRIAAMHAPPPMSDVHIAARRGALDSIEAWIRKDPEAPSIVAADLNITPYTAVWRDFIRASGLVDPRRGRGVLTTWPAFAPDPFRIPIDHILHNGKFRTVSLKTGEWLGSDHLAMIAEVELYNK
jgi:endonuclease/exonuclease/phosphatase (EEP) superfamily protein YafD